MNYAPINPLNSIRLLSPHLSPPLWGGRTGPSVAKSVTLCSLIYAFLLKKISEPKSTTKSKKYRKGKVKSDKKCRKGRRRLKKRKESTTIPYYNSVSMSVCKGFYVLPRQIALSFYATFQISMLLQIV